MLLYLVRKHPAWFTIILIAVCVHAAADQPPPRANVAELLRALSASGGDVLYSSELVPSTLDAPESAAGSDLMSRVVAALAVHHLMLRSTGPQQYVVTRAPASPVAA